ncbi:hypothetical protein CAOG_06733 [Capsaspora owczarzaki ATCC 30864]|uniref:Mediator of RNA polymerase II transcription subunit 11 n=1 Tax=Capsaspora owczarzaki (strain ATCC 30864) TaxID=595528 RepID=A0A0D2UMY2_CAPO3|nr:hypothetical protein CAOG_06733 [Capsaspora owczarzaki ATCC 30864]KJE96401.1 hypothetical protein CAOG_006733 [Capsaspora owczarzaki ATCC 30864]|eukprot:XP_004344354.1 hypothetical protein CAOG_06733 [Capsaspora owczarzaki ATCC 30864]
MSQSHAKPALADLEAIEKDILASMRAASSAIAHLAAETADADGFERSVAEVFSTIKAVQTSLPPHFHEIAQIQRLPFENSSYGAKLDCELATQRHAIALQHAEKLVQLATVSGEL